ncbi:putative membrane protein [Pseudocercospora fuligena]|uniref:Putative membrane protein n=1 Tax=Pseudocercospora fuligena TaxID=685502 RepID=A0A8H6RIB0_9PEZI|nr:putative membrane protein [Pseudocercospora fuligena]
MASIPLATLEPKLDDSQNVERSPNAPNTDGGETDREAKEPLLEANDKESIDEDVPDAEWTLEKRKGWRRPAMHWLVPVYLLYTLGYGGIWVPKLDLIYDLTCRTYCMDHECKATSSSSNSQSAVDRCRAPEIQGLAAEFVMVCNLLGGIISIFTCPKFGELSDLHGRTRVLAIGGLGMLVNCILTILVATFPDTFPLPWLYVTYILESVLGPYASIMAIVNSYAADITTPQERNVAFGYLQGCLYAGVAAGPLLAAGVVELTGSIVLVFWLALAGVVIFMLCMGFLVPESMTGEQRSAARTAYEERKSENASSWYSRLKPQSLVASLKTLWPTGPGTSRYLRRNLVLLAAIDTTLEGIVRSSFSIIVYISILRFGWDTFGKSIFMGAINIVRAAGLVLILPFITWYFKGSGNGKPAQQIRRGCDSFDLGLIRCGALLNTLGWTGYSIATSPILFVAAGILIALAGIGRPVVQSSLTKHVPSTQTGLLMGASALLYGLMRVLSPILMNGFYTATVGVLPGATFACLGGVCGILTAFSFLLRPGVYLDETQL